MRNAHRKLLIPLIAAAMCVLIAAPARAQTLAEKIGQLEQDAIAAFYAGDLDTAERLLRRHAKADPKNPVPHYNLACVLASRGELEPAMDSLKESIERGFSDRHQIEVDPHLANLREMPAFLAIIDRWDEVLEARAQAVLEAAKKAFGRSYTFERDEAHRLIYTNSYTPESFADAKLEIEHVAQWSMKSIFDHAALPAEVPADAWVMIVLPKQSHFRQWAVRQFGAQSVQGTTQIGGLYDHDAKELWASDLGGTLRHEFFHVLHWRSMNALGQRHPLWVQEGLAALVETLDTAGAPTPCWRTNLVHKQARGRHLIEITQFAGKRGQRVYRDQPLRFYAQARGIFLYLHERGVLDDFYAHLAAHYREDPTALVSLLAVTDTDAEGFDAAFRSWAMGLPEVPQDLKRGDAALGVRIDVASMGEGIKITGFPGRRPPELRLGDIITHVAGQPTRDYYELVRVVSSHSPGEEVEVRFRRRRTHSEVTITLREVR